MEVAKLIITNYGFNIAIIKAMAKKPHAFHVYHASQPFSLPSILLSPAPVPQLFLSMVPQLSRHLQLKAALQFAQLMESIMQH